MDFGEKMLTFGAKVVYFDEFKDFEGKIINLQYVTTKMIVHQNDRFPVFITHQNDRSKMIARKRLPEYNRPRIF